MAELGALRAQAIPYIFFCILQLGSLPGCRRWNPIDSHIWPQSLRNKDRAIGLLIVLDNRDPCAPDGQPGAVQRVDKLTFSAGLRPEADAGATRLKGFAVR